MKVSDAPREGWYPDPEGGARLRWWDGTDWADRYRQQPEAPVVKYVEGDDSNLPQGWPQIGNAPGQVPPTAAAIVEEVRMATRVEAERAAQDFERRARAITGEIPPLISQYTNKFMRLIRFAIALAFFLVVLWFIWQVYVSQGLFDWLGDRIDNITNNGSSVVLRVASFSRR